jgi:hypothetical protein
MGGPLTQARPDRTPGTVLELPTKPQAEWLRSFGAAAVAVFTTANGTAVAATQDLARSLRGRRKSYADSELAAAWWAGSLTDALRIADNVDAPDAPEEAEKAIRHTACQLGIALTHNTMALARAKTALARLDAGLKLATQRGILFEFNQRFKYLRRKNPKLNYGAAHHRLKFEVARRIAEAGAGTLPDLHGIVEVILPLK